MGEQLDIPGCQFNPWVGEDYQHGFEGGPRLLILGEAHYGDDPPGRWFTQRLTREYAENQFNHRFWTGIMQVVMGRPRNEITEIDRMHFWQSVALYNFIQVIVGPGPRRAPPDEAWPAARPAFDAVLEALRPQALLVAGKRLWYNIPDSRREGPTLQAESPHESWLYPLQDTSEILTTWIKHPSSGFSWKKWHPVVAALLSRASPNMEYPNLP